MVPNTEIFINEIVNFESQSPCYPNAPRIQATSSSREINSAEHQHDPVAKKQILPNAPSVLFPLQQ